MSVSENEGFMSRWSRRKQEVELESRPEVLEEAAALKVDESSELKAEEPEKTAEEIEEERLAELNALTDVDMPDVETLDEGSDYSGFMSTNVSESLRKIALQKLFHGKCYNIRDGLDEYDDDYTKFEKLDPSTITADMKHMFEVEAKRKLEKEEQEAQEALELANAEAELDSFDEFNEDDIEDMDDSFDDDLDEGIDLASSEDYVANLESNLPSENSELEDSINNMDINRNKA